MLMVTQTCLTSEPDLLTLCSEDNTVNKVILLTYLHGEKEKEIYPGKREHTLFLKAHKSIENDHIDYRANLGTFFKKLIYYGIIL